MRPDENRNDEFISVRDAFWLAALAGIVVGLDLFAALFTFGALK